MSETNPPLDLSLVLACYNEGPKFEKNVYRIFEALDATVYSYEVIFVDDRSADDTPATIRKIPADNPERRLRTLFHEKNMGRGRTVCDGMALAGGEVVGFVDVDLEVPAHYIGAFVTACKKGLDVCIARRVYKFTLAAVARFFSSVIYRGLIHRTLPVGVTDTEVGYKFFRREKLPELLAATESPGWFWDTEVCFQAHRLGLSMGEIPTVFLRDREKKSTVRLIPDTIDYLKSLHHFTKKLKAKRAQEETSEA